jgi:hypothetical protein
MNVRSIIAVSVVALATMLAGACTYVPSAEVKIVPPPTGSFERGDPVSLAFDPPILPETLAIRVWSGERDIENEKVADKPLLERCTRDTSPCGTTELEVPDDGKSAVVHLDPDDLGQPDVPLILEIMVDLETKDGGRTKVPIWLDFQFKPKADACAAGTDIPFDEGVYIIVGTIEKPMPTVLTLISEIRVNGELEVAIAGAEGDELPGYPRNTRDPEGLMVDTSDQGFAIHGNGRLSCAENGDRFLESLPFNIEMVQSSIGIKIHNVRLLAKIETNEETGKDHLSGTLPYESVTITLVGTPTEYEGGTAPYEADWVPEDLVPAGIPEVCGKLCGDVPSQCTPPEDFPGDGFCE